MFEKATSGRDAFTFSLKGMTTIASFNLAPAIAGDRLNKAWDAREKALQAGPQEDQPVTTILEIEDFLARYFAPGCCRAA